MVNLVVEQTNRPSRVRALYKPVNMTNVQNVDFQSQVIKRYIIFIMRISVISANVEIK